MRRLSAILGFGFDLKHEKCSWLREESAQDPLKSIYDNAQFFIEHGQLGYLQTIPNLFYTHCAISSGDTIPDRKDFRTVNEFETALKKFFRIGAKFARTHHVTLVPYGIHDTDEVAYYILVSSESLKTGGFGTAAPLGKTIKTNKKWARELATFCKKINFTPTSKPEWLLVTHDRP